MKKLTKPLMLLATLAVMLFACSDGPNPTESLGTNPQSVASIALPEGAVFQSATFSIWHGGQAGQTVTLHRITAPWLETVVTWNSFAGSYDPAVEGSFVTYGWGWVSVDVTTLVQSWMDGTYENYGFYLKQMSSPLVGHWSSEEPTIDGRPKLVISYMLNGSPGSMTIQRGTMGEVADVYIMENVPDYNNGTSDRLYTGIRYVSQKQTLIMFELPELREVAAIGDTVWIDLDEDGIQDAGEPGFPDVTVNLYDCFDNFVATTTTDDNGYYLFSDLTPGDYYVEFIEPEGYDFTLQNQGADDAVDSDADPVTGIADCTNLEGGETDVTWDAGLYMPVQDGCSLTIGFWKTHAGFGPQADVVTPLLPILLGDSGGTYSINVLDAGMAVDILSMDVYGDQSNGITKLLAQMLGAKLNIANGANGSSVGNTISKADAFLADHHWSSWSSLSDSDQNKVLRWKDKFDDYNNGVIGPGHCDD